MEVLHRKSRREASRARARSDRLGDLSRRQRLWTAAVLDLWRLCLHTGGQLSHFSLLSSVTSDKATNLPAYQCFSSRLFSFIFTFRIVAVAVSYTHLTLPTIYSV